MTIDALVTGTLFKNPEERRSNAGTPFVTAVVRAASNGGEGLFIRVAAFDDTAKTALLALESGDSVALAGALKIDTWEARNGAVKPSLNLIAYRVLTAYHVKRKRKAMNQQLGAAPAINGDSETFDDDL